jgi:CMP-N-acetylneuraminic acid synthetase
MTNILAIIPARAGSKRLPKKNIRLLNGKPLVSYAIETALKSSLITSIAVSSDCQDVLDVALNYGNVKAIKRPAELASDMSPAIDYVRHAIAQFETIFDYIVILQPTSPLTHVIDVDHTIQLLINNPEANSSVSVMRLDHAIHPIKLKTLNGSVLLPYWEEENERMAAHDLPELFVRNCSVYVSNMNTVLSGKIIGDNCLGYLMPRERSVDINELIDFEFAEFLYNKYYKENF